ncbi:MAG: hypothetical protein ABIG68_09775 [Acidobacteriota bacterium]
MKTSRKDFEKFKTDFRRWQRLLGLSEYNVSFFHVPLREGRSAEIRTSLENRLCEARMTTELDYKAGGLGRHEALELLLDHMDTLARYRFIRPEEIDAARHAVIRRLEDLFDRHGLR